MAIIDKATRKGRTIVNVLFNAQIKQDLSIPDLRTQGEVNDTDTVYCRFHDTHGYDWHILEAEVYGDNDYFFYALINGRELAYCLLSNFLSPLNESPVQRDIHFQPKPLGDVKQSLRYRRYRPLGA
jgi:hypothetical protein